MKLNCADGMRSNVLPDWVSSAFGEIIAPIEVGTKADKSQSGVEISTPLRLLGETRYCFFGSAEDFPGSLFFPFSWNSDG